MACVEDVILGTTPTCKEDAVHYHPSAWVPTLEDSVHPVLQAIDCQVLNVCPTFLSADFSTKPLVYVLSVTLVTIWHQEADASCSLLFAKRHLWQVNALIAYQATLWAVVNVWKTFLFVGNVIGTILLNVIIVSKDTIWMHIIHVVYYLLFVSMLIVLVYVPNVFMVINYVQVYV